MGNATKKDRNSFVDIMRGIAMLLVVLGHTMTGCTEGSEKSFIFNVIWSLQMPLFILISGFVTKYSREITTGLTLANYIKRRTMAYILPWIVWSFIIRGFIFGEHDYLNIKWLLFHMDSGYWFLATIWTISMLFGITKFISSKIIKDDNIKQQVVFSLFYGLSMSLLLAVGHFVGMSFFAIKLTLYYMPFYYFGYLYGKYSEKINSNKNGKIIVESFVAICFVSWIFVLLRIHLYEMTDSGVLVALRAVTSLAGCIAVCGLLNNLFVDFAQNAGGGKNCCMDGLSFARNISCPLSAFEYHSTRDSTCICDTSRESINGSKFHNDSFDCDCNYTCHRKECGFKFTSIWQQKVTNIFIWCGNKSLEIYLFHGLVLNILKTENPPSFSCVWGIVLALSNFALTMIICKIVITILEQNVLLCKLLRAK